MNIYIYIFSVQKKIFYNNNNTSEGQHRPRTLVMPHHCLEKILFHPTIHEAELHERERKKTGEATLLVVHIGVGTRIIQLATW